ncbi:MAG: MBL fold metallo-hydrolase [Desulfatiglandales bacterium]
MKSADRDMLYAGHFKDGRFFNPWMPQEEKGFLRFLKWRFSSPQEYSQEEKDFRPDIVRNARERILGMPAGDFIMWVGHATFLMRLGGEYWLTDPMFSERAFLPKRKTPPGIRLEDLLEIVPGINVIISHNHYDHLDKKSLLALPEDTPVYVPLGLKAYVQGMNKNNVTQMDWWQRVDLGAGRALVCLPAQHWSRRIGQGFNETLWAGYMLITPKTTVFFGGDSGYFVGYEEIGMRYPGIDYALLPTTAFHPRWFMHQAHMDIAETLEAFKDLKARFMIPHQWGTFHLGNEPVGYPALQLKKTIAQRGLDPSRFLILDIGEIHGIADDHAKIP